MPVFMYFVRYYLRVYVCFFLSLMYVVRSFVLALFI